MALTKSSAEILTSRLCEWDSVNENVRITSQRRRHEQFSLYFRLSEGLCCCHDVRGLFHAMGIQLEVSEWRLFIDSSCRSLKAVLLHNTNQWPSIPLAHSVQMKETYDNMKVREPFIIFECSHLIMLNFFIIFRFFTWPSITRNSNGK